MKSVDPKVAAKRLGLSLPDFWAMVEQWIASRRDIGDIDIAARVQREKDRDAQSPW